MNASDPLQIFCGLSDNEIARVAQMQKPPRAPDLGEITEFKKLAFLSRSSTPAGAGKDAWMRAEIPASNVHADARSLAASYVPLR